jgi:hypothetical protein
VPLDAPAPAPDLAETLTSLAGPTVGGELAGETQARQAYRRVFGSGSAPDRVRIPARARRRSDRMARRRAARINGRLIAAAVAVTALLGGGAAAAYAGALPNPVQDLAHRVIGAPPARPSPAPSSPQAARRLCAAYQRALAADDEQAVVATYRRLRRAAGGRGQVRAYCAAAGRPGVTTAPPGAPGADDRGANTPARGARLAPTSGSPAVDPGRGSAQGNGPDSNSGQGYGAANGNGNGNPAGSGKSNAGGSGNGNAGRSGNGNAGRSGNGNAGRSGNGNAGGNGNATGQPQRLGLIPSAIRVAEQRVPPPDLTGLGSDARRGPVVVTIFCVPASQSLLPPPAYRRPTARRATPGRGP